MRIELAYVTPRRQKLKSDAAQVLVEEYTARAARFTPVQAISYGSEELLFAALDRIVGRAPAVIILLDSRGENLTSEQIAARLGRLRDTGTQQVTLAVGPADGWSAGALQRAAFTLAFGAATLPHELALVVLAEQVYRALTILAGHPYHGGHT